METCNSEKMKERLAAAVMRYSLPVIIALIVLDVFFIVILEDKTLIAVVSGLIGSVITALINERLTLIQYFFGSSKGSDDKQKTIDKKLEEK